MSHDPDDLVHLAMVYEYAASRWRALALWATCLACANGALAAWALSRLLWGSP